VLPTLPMTPTPSLNVVVARARIDAVERRNPPQRSIQLAVLRTVQNCAQVEADYFFFVDLAFVLSMSLWLCAAVRSSP